MAVILYDIRRRINLVQQRSDYQPKVLWNLPMDTADFKVYAGVDNHIEFVLNKTDRKPINIVGKKVTLFFKDRYSGELIHTQELVPLNVDKAIMLLVLPKSVTNDWSVGALSYGAIIEEPSEYDPNTTKQILLFTDERENSQGFCHVMRSPVVLSAPQNEDEAFESTEFEPNIPNDEEPNYDNDLGFDPDYPGNQNNGNGWEIIDLNDLP